MSKGRRVGQKKPHGPLPKTSSEVIFKQWDLRRSQLEAEGEQKVARRNCKRPAGTIGIPERGERKNEVAARKGAQKTRPDGEGDTPYALLSVQMLKSKTEENPGGRTEENRKRTTNGQPRRIA